MLHFTMLGEKKEANMNALVVDDGQHLYVSSKHELVLGKQPFTSLYNYRS